MAQVKHVYYRLELPEQAGAHGAVGGQPTPFEEGLFVTTTSLPDVVNANPGLKFVGVFDEETDAPD